MTGSLGAVRSLDIAQRKEVLGHYVTGVVIITALSLEGPVGFTCQIFGSLSIDSALVFFAASTSSTSWLRIRENGVLAINVLRDDQRAVARAFATSGSSKFGGVTWSTAPYGSPLLEGCLAHLEGTISEVTNHGDHDIAVASINFASVSSGLPLVYYRGGYRVLA